MSNCKLPLLLILAGLLSCRSQTAAPIAEEPEIVTPVTVTSFSDEAMAEYIELNATSSYLQQGIIKASANGYITSVNIHPGNSVSSGQTAFVEQTKEARSIGNAINVLDSSFKFSGIINVKSGISGYVSEVNHLTGDYVQEGEQLAVVNDTRSFVFILNLPYELRPYVLDKKDVQLILPDGNTITGNIRSAMPVVDSIAQTQKIIIAVNEKNLPINLIAKVRVQKISKQHAVSLPKKAVLSDETQSDFWVMKVIDSATAVKVPIKKGIETNELVEIVSPTFLSTDLFLANGNYGLADTAKIKIIKE